MLRITAVVLISGLLATFSMSQDSSEVVDQQIEAYISARDAKSLFERISRWQQSDGTVRHAVILRLAASLQSTKRLALDESEDLIIANRNLPFHGHGRIIRQDLFIENGRCAYGIERLLSIRLPAFTENMNSADLHKAVVESQLRIIGTLKCP